MAKLVDREDFGREFLGDKTLELRDECVHSTGEGMMSEYAYGTLGKIVENDGHLYVYIGKTMAFLIPLSIFESEGQKQAFIALIEDGKKRAAEKAA